MHRNWAKRILWTAISGLVVAGLVWFAWPAPLAVDIATITKAPMEVTIDDDGKTVTSTGPFVIVAISTARGAGHANHTRPATTSPETAVHSIRFGQFRCIVSLAS